MTAAPSSADVVVVGGGVIGTSIAFHLAEAGADVCLLERDQLAGGSTSRAAGGMRAQFSDPLNIAIGLRSIEAFDALREAAQAQRSTSTRSATCSCSTERTTSLRSRRASRSSRSSASRAASSTLDEVAELSPLAALDGVLAATFCALDGHASPEAVTQGYAAGARSHGGSVLTGCAVTDDRARRRRNLRDRDEPRANRHGNRRYAQPACGRRSIARSVGVELPVQPYLREVGFTGPVGRTSGARPAHYRLLNRLLFPPRGPRAPLRDGRPRAASRLRRSERPGVARARHGGGRAAMPVAAGHGHRRRLEGLLRGDARPQRAGRRVAGRRVASSTRRASRGTASCRGLPSARSCATSYWDASPSSTSPPLSAERFAPAERPARAERDLGADATRRARSSCSARSRCTAPCRTG